MQITHPHGHHDRRSGCHWRVVVVRGLDNHREAATKDTSNTCNQTAIWTGSFEYVQLMFHVYQVALPNNLVLPDKVEWLCYTLWINP